MLKTYGNGSERGLLPLRVLNTSVSIFCESIAFFVVKACERALPKASRAASELPRVLHHDLEVVIAVDRTADSLVVFAELFEGDDAVRFLRVPLDHEFLEDLIWGLLSLLNLGVFAGVVDLGDVLKSDSTVLVDVKFVVRSSDPDLASVVNLTFEGTEELVVTDRAVTVAIEMRDEVLSLLEGEVEAVVDETPTEVLDIKLAVTVIIHSLKDSGDALDSAAGTLEDFSFDFGDEVVDGESLELLHGDGVAGVGGVAEEPDVLVVLELGWHIRGDVTLAFESQVLGAIQNRERVAHDLLFAAEIVSVALIVRSEIVSRAAVTEQDWVGALDGLTLAFHAEVRVGGIDHPDASVG